MKKVLAFTSIILLTACNTGWNLNQLKSTKLEGSDYVKFLAREYLDYSQSEADQYDWESSSYFANKGLKAAQGKEVEPETPEDWKIKNPLLSVVKDARANLLAVTTEENKQNKPELLARAQARFDCWVEQLEEGWQDSHINICKDDFLETIEKLKTPPEEKPIASLPETPASEPVKPELKTEKKSEIRAVYQVYFNLDSANLNKEAKELIKRIKSDLGGNIKEIEVVSSGYADRSGKETHNLKLSKKRAEQVKHELTKTGFTRDKITVYAFGESDNSITTTDGKKEPKNRRVEIIIK